ncbi:MAG: extracellular solute-binding protein, partial [Clostridia bacterium]
MKKNKFICIALIVLLGATLTLAGCEDTTRQIPGWDDTKQNVVFYTWGSSEENLILQDIIDEFESVAGNENINVIIQKAGNDYYGDLELKLAGKQSPDIVLMKPGYIQPYLKSGAIISLQEYISKSTLIDEASMIWDVNDGYRYNSATKVIGNSEDNIYALIKDFSPDFVLNYNKNKVNNIVAQGSYPKEDKTNFPSTTIPMTYSQFIDFAGAMQTADGKLMGTVLDNEPYQQLLEWIQQGGGSLYSADDRTVVDIKNTPSVRAAFDYYRMLRDETTNNPVFDSDNCAFTQNNTALAISKLSSVQIGPGQLKQNQSATMFYGRWAYTAYNMNENVSACNIGFAPPPVPNGLTVKSDTKYAGITAMVGMAISAKSAQKEAAFKFMEYYFTKGMEGTAKIGYNIPGNKA